MKQKDEKVIIMYLDLADTDNAVKLAVIFAAILQLKKKTNRIISPRLKILYLLNPFTSKIKIRNSFTNFSFPMTMNYILQN